MKIEKLNSAENLLQVVVSGTDASFMNAIRREANRVPTLAIEDVYFTQNSSALYDEMVALRLGLLPLRGKLNMFALPEKCKCKGKGCKKCQTAFSLDVKGPITVYAKDLVSKDKGAEVIYPDMILVKLMEGQEMKLKAIASLGTGSQHMKWSPGLVFFQKYTSLFEGNKEVKPVPNKEFADFSRKLLDLENIPKGVKVSKKAEIKTEDDKFILTIESWGQILPKDILVRALDSLKAQVKLYKLK